MSIKDIEGEEVPILEGGFDPSKTYHNLPLVVIVGRPNVGKSTLFNRLMGKRLAITDPTPGVTRDPVEGVAFISGYPVKLMDTGGFTLTKGVNTDAGIRAQREATIDALVVERTLAALDKGDLILLLLDATGVNGEDLAFIDKLRPYQNKLVVCANKTEGGRYTNEAYNFMQYGFKELLFISSEHGDNIDDLRTTIVQRLKSLKAFDMVKEGEESHPIRIAILGKPNTGKSTLCNRLTHTQSSIVSDYAGTTRDVVEGSFRHNGEDFVVLDTAGIRRKTKVDNKLEYYSVNRAIKTLDNADVVFLILDANEGFTDQDKKICLQAFLRGRGIIFVLNKWDTQAKGNKAIRDAIEAVRFNFSKMSYAPVVTISAKEGDGIKALMDMAVTVWGQLNKKVDTSALNMAIKEWTTRYPPPSNSRGASFRLKYMVQSSTNPVRFIVFASNPKNIPRSYLGFLQNRVREDLGFDKIPIVLEFRTSRAPWEERNKEGE